MNNHKKKLEFILKHNLFVQNLYKRSMSFVFRLASKFITTDNKLILFSSFGGRKFNDSPKVLFDALTQDTRFKDFKLVWAFDEPEKFNIPNAKSIKIDSWNYFKTSLQAKIWITSVNIERGLHYKKANTVYINTWHGAGTKKIGNACSGRQDYDFSAVDMMLVQSHFEKEIFERDFLCNTNAIRIVGFPRNDELFHITDEMRQRLRKQFNIPKEKKVILYAPTWRDSKDGGMSYEFIPPIHMDKWKNRLANEYVMLFRMHAFTTKFEMHYDEFARDVSGYDNLNHILAITDVLITDYSTIVYDSAIAKIPFICFGFDYDTYKDERGFYYDLDKVYPGGVIHTEDEVIRRVEEVVNGADKKAYDAFRNKYIEAGGNATKQIIDELAHDLGV